MASLWQDFCSSPFKLTHKTIVVTFPNFDTGHPVHVLNPEVVDEPLENLVGSLGYKACEFRVVELQTGLNHVLVHELRRICKPVLFLERCAGRGDTPIADN
ncbi:hypothetical protein MUP29_04870 [bacterium]|nr:hypothetical protein [bacterium]